MPREIKKCYYQLNLPFSASVEDVKRQEKVLIKIQRAKALKHGKSRKNKIEKIAISANKIISNIELNGQPNEKEVCFNTSPKALLAELCILIALSIVAVIGYISLI